MPQFGLPGLKHKHKLNNLTIKLINRRFNNNAS